jgi:large conductance mechanosensitive channel
LVCLRVPNAEPATEKRRISRLWNRPWRFHATTGGLDFSNYFTPLSGAVTATGLAEARNQGAVLAWGSFVTVAINFAIIAWILFLLVKGMNRLRRKEDVKTGTADKPAEIPADVKLLTEIRDLMKAERSA